MAPFLRSLLFFAIALSSTTAIPTTDIDAGRLPLIHEHKSPQRSVSLFSPLRTLRDAVIERIWSPPKKSSTKPEGRSTAPANYRTRYGSDVVLRFRIDTAEEAEALSETSDRLYLDVWETTNEWVDIRIAKDRVPTVLGLLPKSMRKAYTPVMHDLAEAVHDTYHSDDTGNFWDGTAAADLSTNEPHDLFFHDYQPLSVLHPWMQFMTSMFPGHAELLTIGKTAQGRDILALRIGAAEDNEEQPRHTIVISGGTHAREWISVSTVTYIAHSLMTQYGDPSFPLVTKLLDHFDLVFIPTLNPDGYEYTWSTDRLWRKNRQPTFLPFCPGVDLDRSFQFGWDGDSTADTPCSENHAGKGPLAGIEARRLVDWATNETKSNNVMFVAFLDLHSYSQQILYPYSYSCQAQPPNLEDLEEVALGLAKAFRITTGHYYGVSSACEGSIGLSSQGAKNENRVGIKMDGQGGSALDFFYHDLGVKYAYQIKLRDTGSYGFLLPKSNIIPTGKEAFEGVLGLGKWLLGNRGIESIDENVWGVEKNVTVDVEKNEVVLEDVLEGSEHDHELRRRRRR